jgi:aminopeptidase N
MNRVISIIFSFTTLVAISQDQLEVIDVLNYDINLEVFEDHDTIVVSEQIKAKLHKKVDSFYIDLHSLNAGKGMVVSQLFVRVPVEYETPVSFRHVQNKIWFSSSAIPSGIEFFIEIQFSGIPETGLIIGQNKFEKRTFFGDNWPNRAHHWFACVDHPSDKAIVSFTVTHPSKYDVVATGRKGKSPPPVHGKNTSHYVSLMQLPTKVMVVGIAEFEKEFINHGSTDFTMTAWAYKEDRENGFKDMAVAKDVINYFVKAIGTYPFEKLDHVQSTTQFGGMENAGNIFYDENAITGEGKMEALIAHEVAHQWFGNSASESDWKHLWLSEGFATYFTDLYWEDKYGTEAMNERLINERERVIGFSKKYNHPVVDTTYESLMVLLNAHSYQKGAWFLHMLRNEVGDASFWSGVRMYYETYKFSNASTSDFQSVMEAETGRDLDAFFHQWLMESQHPILKIKDKSQRGFIRIRQKQKSCLFAFDLEVEVMYADGTSEMIALSISEKKQKIELESGKTIKALRYDPNVKLLFERFGKRD